MGVPGSYPAANVLTIGAGTGRWSTGPSTTTANPVVEILTQMDKAAVRPNTIIMPQHVWSYFRSHNRVLSSVAGVALTGEVTGRVATIEQIKALFNVQNFLIPDAKMRTSADGAAETYGFIWPKSVSLLYLTPGAGINQLCWGKTFRHSPFMFTTIYDQRPGMNGVTYVKGSHSDDEIVTASDAGALLDTVID